MQNRFKEIFFYSRRQRRALLLLAFLILLTLLLQIYLRQYRPVEGIEWSEYEDFISQWEYEDSIKSYRASNEARAFPFDPNTAADSVLRELGFSVVLRRTLINYRRGGGTFRKPADLLRVYGMDTAFYAHLQPWIRIEGSFPETTGKPSGSPRPEIKLRDSLDINELSRQQLLDIGLTEREVKGILGYRERYRPFLKPEDLYEVYNLDSARAAALVPLVRIATPKEGRPSSSGTLQLDINHADSASLLNVKGLGPYFAGHIPAYRQKLGGYYDLHQLLEIPGMDSLRVKQIRRYLVLDSNAVIRMNINEVSFEELHRHPYFGYRVARNIVRFRQEYRQYQKVDELMNLELIDEVLFSKIARYLKVEEVTSN